MSQVNLLRIVVASPGDVQPERDALAQVVEELNGGVAKDRNLRLELVRWETDAYPGFHPEGPQGLIDSILRVEDCEVLIGIFWKRFGTPTKDAASGTEHEFRKAYQAWKSDGRPQIMLYFNQRPAAPKSKSEADQWGQVLEFQQNFVARGLTPGAKSVVTGDTLWKFIVSELPETLRDFGEPLRQELLDQGGLLLLDGLDEVPEAERRREQVKAAVEGLAAMFPKLRLLVTSRTYAYQKQDWKLKRFAEAVLSPFGRAQIQSFVERWYAHVGPMRGLKPEDAQGKAAALNQAIDGNPRLFSRR